MLADLELEIGFLRIGVHTHNAAAVTMFCAVPRPVCVKHLTQEELVLLLVCRRALQRGVEIKAAVETYVAWLSRTFERLERAFVTACSGKCGVQRGSSKSGLRHFGVVLPVWI